MKEKVAHWLIRLAEWICPTINPVADAWGVPKKLGLCYHVDKKDIRKYHKKHPEFHSSAAAKRALVKECMSNIGATIAGTLANEHLIHYETKVGMNDATISGYIGIYVSKKKASKIDQRAEADRQSY